MGDRNAQDGTGNSIKAIEYLTVPKTFEQPYPRGFVSGTDGTLRVVLADMDSEVDIPAVATAEKLYEIKEVVAGGSITLTDVYVFW